MTDREFKRWARWELKRQKRHGLLMIILGIITLPYGLGLFLLPLGIQEYRSNELGWLAD